MSAVAVPYSTLGPETRRPGSSGAGVLTGIVDALWAIVLTVFIYQRGDAAGVWKRRCKCPLGKDALTGGTPMTLLGLVMHFCVAFTWSAVFLLLVSRSSWLRSVLDSPYGVLKVAAIYGPCIWIVIVARSDSTARASLSPRLRSDGSFSSPATFRSSDSRSSRPSAPDRDERGGVAPIIAEEEHDR